MPARLTADSTPERTNPMPYRIGTGYDAHRLTPDRKLVLGGVHIPFTHGLDGHSDADVLIHAVIDALLGAAALGDIGRAFPDTDAAYKGIASTSLLRDTAAMLSDCNYSVINIDATIIAQQPKLAGFLPQMCENIASCLDISASQVSVKATTEEKMGFTGAGQGMAAHAICLITNNEKVIF